jgi:hypothetical protein
MMKSKHKHRELLHNLVNRFQARDIRLHGGIITNRYRLRRVYNERKETRPNVLFETFLQSSAAILFPLASSSMNS